MVKKDANHRMFTLNCNGRLLVLDKPVVMGIINATPDSFYGGSRFQGVDGIREKADKMWQEGATIIDIGGQSTRPGSSRVSENEELRRVLAAVEAVHRDFPEAIISVDTYYSKVAQEVVPAGAGMINDISGGTMDALMIDTVGRLSVPYVCMHIRGTPETMHQHPEYDNVFVEVLDHFIQKIAQCRLAGIKDVVIDPGFGFGKTITHNFRLLRELPLFSMLGKPLLTGISRKSTVYKTLGITPEDALNGTTVLNTLCLLKGSDILRVHDVKEAVEAVTLIQAYQDANQEFKADVET